MTGHRKFSELEAGMTTSRRARIDRLAENLGRELAARQSASTAETTIGNTYRYRLIHNGKVVYYGISTDPQRRLSEHRARWPGATVDVIGPAVSREAALKWRSAANREHSRV